jgi:hypothetical protein
VPNEYTNLTVRWNEYIRGKATSKGGSNLKLRSFLVWAIVLCVLALVTLLGTVDTIRAGTFNPESETTVDNPVAGAHSGFKIRFNVPQGDVQFGAAISFIPPEWEITPDEEIPLGTVVGRVDAVATLGIINFQCDSQLPVQFIMLKASTDITDTVDFEDADKNGVGDVFEDKDNSGLLDAIEKYPEHIKRIIGDAQPIARSAGITRVSGREVLLQFLVFEPGTLLIREIPSDEELGYPTMTFLQNIGDPEGTPDPQLTDFCTRLLADVITFGVSKDNGCTDAVPFEELDPICSVGSARLLECDDLLDNDGDQTVNDGCPAIGDEAESECADEEDNDGDGWINDGCPAIEEPEDSTPTEPDESGLVLFTNPEEGTYTFTVGALGQRDADGDGFENALDTCPLDPNQGSPRIKGEGDIDEDGLDAACDPDDNTTNSDEDMDGYLNRGDNCPLVPNGEEGENQRDSDLNEQGDPRPDGIGDACDPNPDVPDGEAIFSEASSEVTITPSEAPPAGPSGGEDGGGAIIFVVIGVIAAVVVLGGGGFYFMRRRGG